MNLAFERLPDSLAGGATDGCLFAIEVLSRLAERDSRGLKRGSQVANLGGEAEDGVKVTFYRDDRADGAEADPDALDRQIHDDEVARLAEHLSTRLPTLPGW